MSKKSKERSPESCWPAPLQMVTEGQLKQLELYKHSSGKTAFEEVLLKTVTGFFEWVYPDMFNANFITMVGLIPQFVTTAWIVQAFGFDGTKGSEKNDDQYFIWSGLALLWFN